MEVKNKKVVVYCRVAHSEDSAMKAQTESLMRFANAEGYAVDECYCDNGESGVTLDRPEMNRLLSDIRRGNIKTVIAKDLSRIARNFMLGMKFVDEAQKFDVTVVTVHDDIAATISMFESLVSIFNKNKNFVGCIS